MAGTIKGITVEIGGDTTGLDKALKGTNKEIKSTQSELKDVNRLLKLDPTNTELLKQKQQLLKKAVGETADKLKGLKEASKNVTVDNKKYDEWTKTFSSLQGQITKSENKLDSLKKTKQKLVDSKKVDTEEYKKVEAEISKATEKLDGLKQKTTKTYEEMGKPISEDGYRSLQREIATTEHSLKDLKEQAAKSNVVLQKIGKTAEKVAEKTKGMSAVAGGALGALAIGAVKAGKSADDLNTLSKQTGVTTAELQKMQYASELVDVSVDTITGSMKKMKKNMASTSKETQSAWQTLGLSVTDSTGHMKNSTDMFYETIGALSKVGNETERDQLAMQIFGKSADELAGVIDDGGASLKQLGNEAENAGLIMSQEAVDGANEFNDSIDKLKASATASFGKIAGELAKTLIPIIEKVSKVVSNVLNWFSKLSPTTKKIILIILAVIAAISPIAGIISGITTIVGVLNAVMAASPITWIVLGIVAAVAALVAIIIICVKHWDEIKSAAKACWDAIKNAFSDAWNWFKTKVVDPIANLFEGIWNGIKKGAAYAWYGIKYGAISMVNFVIKCMNTWIKGVLAPFNLIIDGLNLLPDVSIKKLKFEIPKIKLPELPKMAKGGTLFNGSAIVGEAGPELLTQMGSKTRVTPLTNNTSNTTNNFGARQLVNVFEVGGQTITKVIQPINSIMSANKQLSRGRCGRV